MEYIGCSPAFLREHLENQFTEGMTWENQGQWEVDHIRPCASFALNHSDPEVAELNRRACFHYTNLQPLWASENCSKGAKYDGPMEVTEPVAV